MSNTDDTTSKTSVNEGGDEASMEGREEKSYERPSQRMFRRSRAAQVRRQKAVQKEAKFMRFVAGIAGFALLLTFLFVFMFADMTSAAETAAETATGTNTADGVENASTGALMAPVLGNFTVLDLAGVAFVLVVGYAVFRRYKK